MYIRVKRIPDCLLSLTALVVYHPRRVAGAHVLPAEAGGTGQVIS